MFQAGRRSHRRAVIGGLVIATSLLGLQGAPAAVAAGAGDVTATIRADRDLVLDGDAQVRLTGGTLTYTGVISGTGTFTVEGTGTLVLTKDSDFTLPADRRRQKVVTYNGNHPLTRVDNPDPAAVVVAKGATLQYGSGSGGAGQIGHYVAVPGLSWNTLNHRVDGTLDLAVHSRVHLGILSGSGLVMARRFTWPGLSLAGTHPFTGVLFNGTGFDYGANEFVTSMPKVTTIVNQGSAIHNAANGVTTVSRADYYSQSYGNDINYHTWGTGVVRNTGVYSWSDNGSITDPRLSRAALNYATVPHNDNKRGINIEGANVEWGDGTTHDFFLPGNKNTVYINMHFDGRERSKLTLNYNGPVRLGAPISGGKYHDTLAAPGQGDVVIAGTAGNAVTFTAPQNYNGSTTIGRGASLRLGNGTAAGDSSLRRGGLFKIVNNGTLILQNAKKAVVLSRISGSGAVTQAGRARTTLTGRTSFTGATTISRGTLRLTGGNLSRSSGVRLTKAATRLDLSKAGAQRLKNLTGVRRSTVILGGRLTLGSAASGTFAGSITGGKATGVVKVGAGTLTLTGASRTPSATWTVRKGTLALGAATASLRADVAVSPGARLRAAGAAIHGSVVSRGAVSGTGLSVSGGFRQRAGATFSATGLTVAGPVALSGTLALPSGISGRSVTLLNNTGPARVTGSFDRLPEGASIDGRKISYRGGDGNDVVLGAAPTGASAAGTAASGGTASFTLTSRPLASTAVPAVIGYWPVITGALLVALLLVGRRRGRFRRTARVGDLAAPGPAGPPGR